MFGLFSSLPLVVLALEPNLNGLMLGLGLWSYLPLGEDIAWYHFAGISPTPEDWTSTAGGYNFGKRWVPRWYLTNGVLSIVFYGLTLITSLT
jgi:hypothetical protein